MKDITMHTVRRGQMMLCLVGQMLELLPPVFLPLRFPLEPDMLMQGCTWWPRCVDAPPPKSFFSSPAPPPATWPPLSSSLETNMLMQGCAWCSRCLDAPPQKSFCSSPAPPPVTWLPLSSSFYPNMLMQGCA